MTQPWQSKERGIRWGWSVLSGINSEIIPNVVERNVAESG